MAHILYLALIFAFAIADNPEERGPFFQGDIIGDPSSFEVKSGLINLTNRWPDKTIVYSTEQSNLTGHKLQMFHSAIQHITGRTCIRFKERVNNETNYVNIIQDRVYCYSEVGMAGSQQNLSLGSGCTTLRTNVHELVHAIGFDHEQNRFDRDQYVNINTENIERTSTIINWVSADKENNFDKLNSSYASPFDVPYDYNSVMHYSSDAFSADHYSDTITPLVPGVILGVSQRLSKYDIRKINNMYCPTTMGIRFQNMANGMYLEVADVAEPTKPVISSNWTAGENQNWTTDWDALRNSTVGSTLATWSQDTQLFVKVMFDLNTSIFVWRDTNATNAKWWIKRIQYAIFSRWQIVNKFSGRCIRSMGAPQAKTVACDPNDLQQIWRIYDA